MSDEQKTTYRQLAIEFKNTKSPAVFAQLYKKIKPRMKSFVLGIVKDPDAADDIVSDAMTTVYTKIDQYNPEFQITTWSYTIAYHQAIQYIRERNRKVSLTVFSDNGIEVPTEGKLLEIGKTLEALDRENFSSLEQDLLEKERIIELRHQAAIDAINSLKPLYKEIMVDRFINKLSYIDIELREKERLESKIADLEKELRSCSEEEKSKIEARIKTLRRKNVNGQTIKNRIHAGRKIVHDTIKDLDIFKEPLDI
jgi:RNA polymerase sigma factor (sigma-70 family)